MQLLHPVRDPNNYGMDDDPVLPYYSNTEKWTAKHAASIGMCGSYRNPHQTSNVEESVK